MNHEQQEDSLELELRRMRPAPVPPRLALDISREIEQSAAATEAPATSRHANWSLWLSWSVSAIAASTALMLALRTPSAPRERDRPVARPEQAVQRPAVADDRGALRVVPVSAAGYLFDARDEGVVLLENGVPARKTRYQYVDSFELSAPGGSGTVNVSFPREEIRLTPLETF